jgi:hypothetical protein
LKDRLSGSDSSSLEDACEETIAVTTGFAAEYPLESNYGLKLARKDIQKLHHNLAERLMRHGAPEALKSGGDAQPEARQAAVAYFTRKRRPAAERSKTLISKPAP